MKKEEIAKLLMIMDMNFPNWKPKDMKFAIETLHEMLSDYEYDEIAMALKAYIMTDTSGFAPTIGQLIDKLHTIAKPAELNEMEAWTLVHHAIRNGYYGAEAEFAKLPPLVQKAIGQPSQLRQWSQSEIDSIETVAQSNFMRSYRAVLAREKEISKMPSEIRSLIEEVNKKSHAALLEHKNQLAITQMKQEEEVKAIKDNTKKQINALSETIEQKLRDLRKELIEGA